MQGLSAFQLKITHCTDSSVLFQCLYLLFMSMKDATQLGKLLQSPPKRPRAETPEAGQWIALRSCSVSFPLVGSSLRTGPGAGLAARPGACPAQLQPASQLRLPGARLFYEQLLSETASLISAGRKQTLQYKWHKLYKEFVSWWCPQLWWKCSEGKMILSAFWICFKYCAFYDFHMILGHFNIKRPRLS